jgi:hypothetical protein
MQSMLEVPRPDEPATILWLRHFKPETTMHKSSIQRAVRTAAFNCKAVAITLRDRSVSTSVPFVHSMGMVIVTGVMVVGTVCVVARLASTFDEFMSGMLIALLAGGLGLFVVSQRHGTFVIREGTASEVESAVRAAAIKFRGTGDGAMVVAKCADSNWQRAVGHFVDRSTVVIVEGSEQTDNLHWEIAQVIRRKRPEQIILVGWQAPFYDVRQLIDWIEDPGKRLRMGVKFSYEEQLAYLSADERKLLYRCRHITQLHQVGIEFERRLQREICECLAARTPIGGDPPRA